ncbi:hypothetical protein BB561_004072 [Smittium simulii]|uniref:Uncharacterized protein n=1 Tax=Smittium simulii TaxID=133385 RepID=A0A2T9YIB2_9FUNG|nr:hypothetical protein BB561_004072 [Smittium simulii]
MDYKAYISLYLYFAYIFFVNALKPDAVLQVKNNTFIGRAVNQKINSKPFSMNAPLSKYFLVPKSGGGSTKISEYLSPDYVLVPCKSKFFHMTFDAYYLTSSGFTITMNPTPLSGQWPAFNGQYTRPGGLNSAACYKNQKPARAQAKTVDRVAACGKYEGKGIKYFLTYDKTGIHIGQNDKIYAEVENADIPPVLKNQVMQIRAGSSVSSKLVISNIQMYCMAGDLCSLKQSCSSTTNQNDVECIVKPCAVTSTTTITQKMTSVTTSVKTETKTTTTVKTESPTVEQTATTSITTTLKSTIISTKPSTVIATKVVSDIKTVPSTIVQTEKSTTKQKKVEPTTQTTTIRKPTTVLKTVSQTQTTKKTNIINTTVVKTECQTKLETTTKTVLQTTISTVVTPAPTTITKSACTTITSTQIVTKDLTINETKINTLTDIKTTTLIETKPLTVSQTKSSTVSVTIVATSPKTIDSTIIVSTTTTNTETINATTTSITTNTVSTTLTQKTTATITTTPVTTLLQTKILTNLKTTTSVITKPVTTTIIQTRQSTMTIINTSTVYETKTQDIVSTVLQTNIKTQEPIPNPCKANKFTFNVSVTCGSDVYIALVDAGAQIGLQSGNHSIKMINSKAYKRSFMSTLLGEKQSSELSKRGQKHKVKIESNGKKLILYLNGKKIGDMKLENLISLIDELAEQFRLLNMEFTETQKAVNQLQKLPHVVSRAPVANLIFSPKFSEANLLAEEGFFCNSLTEEEHKGILYSRPKKNVMHYVPPVLNDTASTKVKKMQNSLEDNQSQDLDIKFVLEIRLLLADAVSGFTQPQIKANIKAKRRPVKSKDFFCRRQQVVSGIAPAITQIQQATQTASSRQSFNSNKKKIFRQEEKARMPNRIGKPCTRRRLPISFLGGMVKIDRQPMAPKDSFPNQFYSRITRKIDPDAHPLTRPWSDTNYASTLSQKKMPKEESNLITTESIIYNSKKVWKFTSGIRPTQIKQPFSLYQESASNNKIDISLENKDCFLPKQYYNSWKKPTHFPGKHQTSFIKDQKAREILFINKYLPKSNLRTVDIKYSGCSKQVNSANGMFNVGSNIHTAKQAVQRSQHRSICISKQHKIISVLQLFPRSQGILEDCNMVPKSIGTVYTLTTAFKSNRSNSRPKKHKFTLHKNQELSFDGMDNQRRALKNQELGNYARFLEWKQSKNLTDSISAAQIKNYLAKIYFTNKLKPSTIKAYKSAILELVKNPTETTNQRIFTEFFKTLNQSSIRSFIKPSINIGLILITDSNWGSNLETLIKNLTSKLSWMLAVTGLLRSINIHQIDNVLTYITNGALYPVIIAPKKRGGQQVERPCQISEHLNPMMCPVKAYREYMFRVASTPCTAPDINNSS